MPKLSAEQLRNIIAQRIPIGSIVPDHDATGHWYKRQSGERYGSVTTKLQILKDKTLNSYQTNRALDYVFENWQEFNQDTIQLELEKAGKIANSIMQDAADIGTLIHDCRQKYFAKWIETGIRPTDILDFIPKEHYDIRCVSALRALSKFVDEHNYIPICTELIVWDDKLKVAGTLDDIGLMDGKLVLADLKSSNQFKCHYFFQVALYYKMFQSLTGLRPKKCFILKVSKENGTYQIEDLKYPTKIFAHAKALLKVWDGMEYVKGLRKDNQKVVIKL